MMPITSGLPNARMSDDRLLVAINAGNASRSRLRCLLEKFVDCLNWGGGEWSFRFTGAVGAAAGWVISRIFQMVNGELLMVNEKPTLVTVVFYSPISNGLFS